MFDYVRNNKKVVQVFLFAITLPFAFWGIESYMRSDPSVDGVASVGDSKITLDQFQKALGEQRDRMRANLGAQFNPAMLDSPEVRRALLDTLINQRLLALYAADSHMTVSNDQLAAIISSVPQLQVDGKFSVERFEQLAAAQGLSKAGLEARIRQELAMRQSSAAVVEGSLVSRSQGNLWLGAALESRDVSEISLKPEAYMAQVKLAADAAKTFYETNSSKFEVPEQVRFEFVVLSQAEIAQKLSVTDAEAKDWYDSHQDRYQQPEERRASHILILAEKNAKPEEVKAAEAKIKDILQQVQTSPADFAKLAKQYSQDPGSAKAGGDLGVVARGMMVKPFEEAVFALKENQISDVVRTDYGFHIIRLSSLKQPAPKAFAAVKAEIVAELKSQNAAKKYAEAAEVFTNMVYEQADSLKPVAEKFGLTVQQGPWLPKGRPVQGFNDKLLAAIFSNDAIEQKRNTEAVEIAPNTLLSARVVEHKAASTVPLEQVKGEIEKRLTRDEAVKLAAQDAEARVAKLQGGEAGSGWGASRVLSRVTAQGMSPDAVRAVFKLGADKLPAYTSATQGDGSVTIYRVNKVTPYVAADKDDDKAAGLRQQYAQLATETDFSAWLAVLRERYKVVVNAKALEKESSK